MPETITPASSKKVNDSLPNWFLEARDKAVADYASLPFPTRKDESWRFGTLKHAVIDDILERHSVSEEVAADLLTRSAELENIAGRMIFANDELIADPILEEGLEEKGVICLPLYQALLKHGDLVKEYFFKSDVRLGGEKYAALHFSRVTNGLFLYVPKGVVIDKPIEVYHWMSGDVFTYPHTLIVADENSNVEVIDYFESANETDAGLCISMNTLLAAKGSTLRYIACQDANFKSRHYGIGTTRVDRDAKVKSLLVNFGSAWGRNESLSHLHGENANSEMLSVTIDNEGQELDSRTLQLHEAPHTYSDLLYKNALFDTARSIFAGLIYVEEGAHFTDAYQKCRNLLLSDEAEANSMPGLEINADQVKCSHGSTSGPISKEELFYLESRGIDELKARELITFGFLNEAIERIGDEDIRSMLAEKVLAKLTATSKG
ncbi:MAG: Fe-S cluster assembly protein SufD [Verrucomicrobiota bacterium]